MSFVLNKKIMKDFDKGLQNETILIDLHKALHEIDFIFLQKLYAIGFSKHLVNWFRSSLKKIV